MNENPNKMDCKLQVHLILKRGYERIRNELKENGLISVPGESF